MINCGTKRVLDAVKYGKCFNNNDPRRVLFLKKSPNPWEDQCRSHSTAREHGSKYEDPTCREEGEQGGCQDLWRGASLCATRNVLAISKAYDGTSKHKHKVV